jgi:hypothetical protein
MHIGPRKSTGGADVRSLEEWGGVARSLRDQVRVIYWPSQKAGGKGVGHIAAMIGDLYVSHVPEGAHLGELLGQRDDLPGSLKHQLVDIRRCPTFRHRSFDNDLAKYGDGCQSLVMPDCVASERVMEAARGWMLVSRNPLELQGPLPYYQLVDHVKGAGGVQNCTTTIARCLGAGLPADAQHLMKRIQQFDPDVLWQVLHEAMRELEERE